MSPVSVTNRHSSQGAPPKGWNCVSCGGANAGPLELGCAICGAGKPGEHVGVPPSARARVVESPQTFRTDPESRVEQAFEAWLKQEGPHETFVIEALSRAFNAGYEMALTTIVQAPPLPGTAESRTVIAALRSFMENVLPMASEEIASGEFLSVQAVEALIVKLERNQ